MPSTADIPSVDATASAVEELNATTVQEPVAETVALL